MVLMLSGEVQNRILQYNPWLTQPDQADALIRRYLPETYVLREAEPVNLQNNRALLIVGPRQSGKSTLAWRLLQSRAPNILYLNLEDPLLRSALPSSLLCCSGNAIPSSGPSFLTKPST